MIDAGYLEQNERLPYRTMDVRLALDWGALRHDLPDWDELSRNSILMQRLRVPYLEESAAYALTHAIFFGVAFGTRPPPRLLLERRPALAATLSTLLVTFSLDRHWDLVGELLLCWECMGLVETPIYRQAWAAFLEQQHDDGAFPSPDRRLPSEPVEGAPDPDPVRRGFASRYHTTLVALMALSCRKGQLRRAYTPARPALEELRPEGHEGSSTPAARSLLATAAARASRWATTLLNTAETEGNHRPDVLCRVLVVSWLCSEILGTMEGDRPDLTDRVASLLVIHDDESMTWTATPAGLKLVSAALLRTGGRTVAVLDSFLERAQAALSAQPRAAVDDLNLCEKRVFLHALGLGSEPHLLDVAEAGSVARSIDLTDPSATEGLLLRVESSTAVGLRRVDPTSASSWLRELLTAIAMHYLRVYDLPRACRVVRALSHLGPPDAACTAECCDYLVAQGMPSGPFGFMGPEVAELTRSEGTFDPCSDLLLPITLDCLWTLAEGTGDGWRLYSALPGATNPWA